MVLRTFGAMDNEALTVVSAPNSSNQNPGDPIINNSSSPDGTIYQFNAGFATRIIELDDTGGDPDVFEDDNPGGHTIVDGKGLVADGQGVESESIIRLRELDVNGNPTGGVISVSVFSQGGNFGNIWGFSPSEPLQPGVQYVKVSGTNNGRSDYEDFIPCFTAGTMIRTKGGLCRVEDLESGDLVWTREGGFVPVGIVAQVTVSGTGKRAPIRFEAGALGNTRTLMVSPQHRMLVTDTRAELWFGEDEVLVPAIHLVGLKGVAQVQMEEVTYVHLVFETHQIVDAEGALTESFFPGVQAMRAIDRATYEEVNALFPELGERAPAPAAPILSGHEARVLQELLAS